QQEARVREAQAQRDKAFAGPRPMEVAAAVATVASAQARYTRAKTGYRNWEIDQAKSELETTEADLRLAKEDYERAESLMRRTARKRTRGSPKRRASLKRLKRI